MSLVIVGCVVCLGCCWPKDALLACWPRFLHHAPDYCLNRRRVSLNMDRKKANGYLRCLPHVCFSSLFCSAWPLRASVIQRLAAPGSKVKGLGSAAALLGGVCAYGARLRPTQITKGRSTSSLECPGNNININYNRTDVSVNMSVCLYINVGFSPSLSS